MSLSLDQFDYHLPPSLIAQRPVSPRDTSRMLVIDRSQQTIHHQLQFKDLPQILKQNIKQPVTLVVNNTKVIPARLVGCRQQNPTKPVELLLLQRKQIKPGQEIWECLTKPGLKPNHAVIFDSNNDQNNLSQKQLSPASATLQANCIKISGYTRLIQFNLAGPDLLTAIHQLGQTPTPPYIEWNATDEPRLRKKYQTVYAKIEGSAAAPTAGLHFTPTLLEQLKQKGVRLAQITLHVGLGTFQPVKTEKIEQHQMHSEWFKLSAKTADQLNQAKRNGHKIIAVGTTSTRVLETCSNDEGRLSPQSGETAIFIKPGYRFKFVRGLITNFHLPKTTLLMLVSALCTQPNTSQPFISFKQTLAGQAYLEAIKQRYRFYSFGDSMLIL